MRLLRGKLKNSSLDRVELFNKEEMTREIDVLVKKNKRLKAQILLLEVRAKAYEERNKDVNPRRRTLRT